jgi:trk system potassium uptake protein TrkH
MTRGQFLNVLEVFAAVLALFSFCFVPVICLAAFSSTQFVEIFLNPALFSLACAGLLYGASVHWREPDGGNPELRAREAMLIVALCWILLPAFAALPLWTFFSSLDPSFSFTRAYFEAVSGLTTTGATTLSGLDDLPISINFWRLFLQWIGGMGILILAVAIIPLIGVGGGQLFRSEATGPLKDKKLTPRITETAKGLWLVYCALTAVCAGSYWIAGMTPWDAILHSFSTLSLGGLSTHDSSFAHFNSSPIEWVAIFFMLIASGNFALYFVAIYRKSIDGVFTDSEFRYAVLIQLGLSLFIFISLVFLQQLPLAFESLRTVLFNVISIASTTGYASTDYTTWPLVFPLLMILFSSFSTSAGSTGAGIKTVRLMVIFQQFQREFRKSIHPRIIDPVRIDGASLDNRTVFGIATFTLIYIATAMFLTILLIASGMQFDTAFSATLATLNNMGPGLNEIGPSGNYAGLSLFQLWLCNVSMILGRIELTSLLVLLSTYFWRS